MKYPRLRRGMRLAALIISARYVSTVRHRENSGSSYTPWEMPHLKDLYVKTLRHWWPVVTFVLAVSAFIYVGEVLGCVQMLDPHSTACCGFVDFC